MGDEREVHAEGEMILGVPGLARGRILLSANRRWQARGAEAVAVISEGMSDAELDARLTANPEVDAMFVQAVQAAAATSLEAKRRLLGRIVREAVLDDAAVDQAGLLMSVLTQVDAAHIRCLEAAHRARGESEAAGELEPEHPDAERAIDQRVTRACRLYPSALVQQLIALNLLDGRVTWSGSMLLTGPTLFGDELLAMLRDPTV